MKHANILQTIIQPATESRLNPEQLVWVLHDGNAPGPQLASSRKQAVNLRVGLLLGGIVCDHVPHVPSGEPWHECKR